MKKLLTLILVFYTFSLILEASCSEQLKICLRESFEPKEYELAISEDSFDILRPSEKYFGMPKIAYVTRKFTYRKFKEIEELFLEKPIYVVKTPNGKLRVVDAHHHILAVFKNILILKTRFGDDFKKLKFKVVELADFTGKSYQSFNKYILDNNYIYLRVGEDLTDLPLHIQDLTSDYERGIVYLLIKGKVITKDKTPFIEFYVGDILKKHIKPAQKNVWSKKELLRYSRFVQDNPGLFSDIPGIKIKKVSNRKIIYQIRKYLESITWYLEK